MISWKFLCSYNFEKALLPNLICFYSIFRPGKLYVSLHNFEKTFLENRCVLAEFWESSLGNYDMLFKEILLPGKIVTCSIRKILKKAILKWLEKSPIQVLKFHQFSFRTHLSDLYLLNRRTVFFLQNTPKQPTSRSSRRAILLKYLFFFSRSDFFKKIYRTHQIFQEKT